MAPSPESNQHADAQKSDQPSAQKASPEPAITPPVTAPKDDAHGGGKNEEHKCQYRGPQWFAGFYCFFAAHEKFWVAFGTIILAAVTLILGAATVFLYLATRALVRGAELTAERQLRAYVLLDSASMVAAASDGTAISPKRPIGIGFQPLVLMGWKNYGQTPAHNVVMSGAVAIADWPLDPSKLPPVPADEGGSVDIIGPQGTRRKLEISTKPLVLSETDYIAIRDGRKAIFAYGVVTYEDAFGKGRTTEYRQFVGGEMGIQGTKVSAHDSGNKAT